MSRKSCRTAVASFFGNGAVSNLNQVTRARRRNTPGAEYLAGGQSVGAVAWVYIEGERERRVASPQGSGKKVVVYAVGLRVDFRSGLTDTESAIDAYDDVIEGIKARLRSDPTLGSAGVVFQAGEGDTFGSDDIEVIADEPKESGKGTTTILSVVRFTLVEFIVA